MSLNALRRLAGPLGRHKHAAWILALLPLAIVTWFLMQPAPSSTATAPSITECRLDLEVLSTSYITFVLRDRRMIRELVEEPLQKARDDPNPAKYILLGALYLIRSDGTSETIVMFDHEGKFKRNGKYYHADFGPLMERVKDTIDITRKEVFGRR